MATMWLEKLRSAKKTCLVQEERKKVHYTFPDGMEMAEEYDTRTNDLLVRKWRKKSSLGVEKWEFEVGDQFIPKQLESEGLMESSSNPICVRKDSKDSFQWRIRNLPYPVETYSLTIDNDHIVIRTSNKKYFKKLLIPDMERASCSLKSENLTFAHANNTLIVTYKKPVEILSMEKSVLNELVKIKACKDGDVECNPS